MDSAKGPETISYMGHSSVSYTLGNGGLAGMIWMYLVAIVGFGAAIASMAEMASMAPTSGGKIQSWILGSRTPLMAIFRSISLGVRVRTEIFTEDTQLYHG